MTLTEISFEGRKSTLQEKCIENTRILPFVTQYRPSVLNLKQIFTQNWHLIQQQPLLRRIFHKWMGVVQARHTLLSLLIITRQATSHHVRVRTLHKPNYSIWTKYVPTGTTKCTKYIPHMYYKNGTKTPNAVWNTLHQLPKIGELLEQKKDLSIYCFIP